MKKLLSTLMVAFGLMALVITGCAAQQADPAAGRWDPYAGCDENQCRSWGSACEADCLNAKTGSQRCITECSTKVERCKETCK